MTTRRRAPRLLALSFVSLAAGGGYDNWTATAGAAPLCVSIVATVESTLTTAGCPSPVGFCTAGTVEGNRGFRGTSFSSALAFNPIPSDGLGRLAVPAVVTYTTDSGTITVSEVSVFDVERGTLAGVSRVVSGTGRFSAATGNLFSTAVVVDNGSGIASQLTGSICLGQ